MWLKLTDDFPARCAAAGLSDAAVRTHIDALCSIMAREKGPVLTARELRRFLESEDADRAVAELLAAGWWVRDGSDGAVRVVENMGDQPEPEVIAKRREATADRKRRERLRRAGLDIDPETGEIVSRRDVPRDGTRDPGRGGTGRVGREHLRDRGRRQRSRRERRRSRLASGSRAGVSLGSAARRRVSW